MIGIDFFLHCRGKIVENCLGHSVTDKFAFQCQLDRFFQGVGKCGNGRIFICCIHVVGQFLVVLDSCHAGTQQHLECDVRIAVCVSGTEFNGAVPTRSIQQLYQRNAVFLGPVDAGGCRTIAEAVVGVDRGVGEHGEFPYPIEDSGNKGPALRSEGFVAVAENALVVFLDAQDDLQPAAAQSLNGFGINEA